MDTTRDGSGRLVDYAHIQCAIAVNSSWPVSAAPGFRVFFSVCRRTPWKGFKGNLVSTLCPLLIRSHPEQFQEIAPQKHAVTPKGAKVKAHHSFRLEN